MKLANLDDFKTNNRSWQNPFTFIQAADTQFGMIESYNKSGIDNNWDEELRLTEKLINIITNLKPKPKFLIICGDLVNSFPGEKFKNSQIIDFKNIFKKLEIPLVCVCGNHDVGNIPTIESIKAYHKDFGQDFFSWWVGGVKFICLNSQYFYDDSQVKSYSQEQASFLDTELKNNNVTKPKHTIVFQHIPWFISEPYEDTIYYNYGLESQGSFNLPREFRLTMLETFRAHGVSKIFCGHYHRNAGGFYYKESPSQNGSTNNVLPPPDEVLNVEMITTSAVGCQLGNDKSGFRVVKVYPDTVLHKYFNIDSFNYNDSFLNI